ncbi:helix-turn-helix domain-containing protein [Massilia sp. DD77]|uniref:helix-turn-helix domain-containing protein n=1 Tax=Massilia sp. DD77 TaxID=3109349 RepID=UPI003000AD0B
MDIAEVAKRSGMAASTLRYYEKKGLIASTGRQGLRRTFGKDVLDQLALISLGQAAGLSLDDIRGMFTPKGPQIDRAVLAARADEIDALVRRLKAMSKGLRHAVACPAPSHMECPTFRKLLSAAGSGSIDRHWRQVGKQADGETGTDRVTNSVG